MSYPNGRTQKGELVWCMKEKAPAQSAGAGVLVVTWSRCTARAQVNLEVALARIRYLRPRLAFRLGTLRMHRLVAALFALIDLARRCAQVCTGYGVVARTATRRACSQSGPGAWSPVGELVSFGLAGTTESSTPVPSVALPVQWRGI